MLVALGCNSNVNELDATDTDGTGEELMTAVPNASAESTLCSWLVVDGKPISAVLGLEEAT